MDPDEPIDPYAATFEVPLTPTQPQIPRVIARRYELRSRLGKGGMAWVWEAWDRRLNRLVAVKIPSLDVSENSVWRRRFQQEAELAGRINHPNVVTVHDHGIDGQLPYLVMELVAGQTLSQKLQMGPLTTAQFQAVCQQTLMGLGAIHAEGIVHRDVKPSNVLCGNVCKLTDFGIARLHQSDATPTMRVMGTLQYLAPERLRGKPASVESDLYAASVMFYEALAGRRPFDDSDQNALIGQIIHMSPPPLPSGIPANIASAIFKGLCKDPAARWHSAAEMLAGLKYGQGVAPHPGKTQVMMPATSDRAVRQPRPLVATRSKGLGFHPLAVIVTIMLLAGGAAIAKERVSLPWTGSGDKHQTASGTTTTTEEVTTTTEFVEPTTTEPPTTEPPTTLAPTTVYVAPTQPPMTISKAELYPGSYNRSGPNSYRIPRGKDKTVFEYNWDVETRGGDGHEGCYLQIRILQGGRPVPDESFDGVCRDSPILMASAYLGPGDYRLTLRAYLDSGRQDITKTFDFNVHYQS